MMQFPSKMSEREEIRMALVERHVLSGMITGIKTSLSYRCSMGDHSCKNDGTGCLCRCHDKRG